MTHLWKITKRDLLSGGSVEMRNATHTNARLIRLSGVLAALAGLLLVPAGAGAAVGDSVGAAAGVSTGGLVASGFASTPSGGDATMTFVIPGGTSAGHSAVPGVDFTRPWGSYVEQSSSSGLFGTASTQGCSTVVNPKSWSAGYQPIQYSTDPSQGSAVQPVSGVYFDVVCTDGRYDFYRVQWDDWINPRTGKPQRTAVDGLASNTFLWGGAVQNLDYQGVVTTVDQASEWGDITVYGHDPTGVYKNEADRFHVLAQGGGFVIPVASLITTSAG